MSSIDSIGGRFVFNGCHRTMRGYPDWESASHSPAKTPLCLGWPILLLPIFRLVARACESVPRRNRELLSQESCSRCSSFARSKMSSLLQHVFRMRFSYMPLFSVLLSIFFISSPFNIFFYTGLSAY